MSINTCHWCHTVIISVGDTKEEEETPCGPSRASSTFGELNQAQEVFSSSVGCESVTRMRVFLEHMKEWSGEGCAEEWCLSWPSRISRIQWIGEDNIYTGLGNLLGSDSL